MIWIYNKIRHVVCFLLAVFVFSVSGAFASPEKGNKGLDIAAAKGGKVGEAQDRIIVKFKDQASPTARDRVLSKHKLREKSEIRQIKVKLMQISDEDTPQEVIDRLMAQEGDNIEFAEIDALVSHDAVVNDPNFSSQWHVTKIGAPTAWDTTRGGSLNVAVLDTGVDCNHPDLSSNCLLPGWNIVSQNTDITDVRGHGTKVAGTLAQVGNNGIGSAGIAYEAKIIPVKITNDPEGYAYFSDIARAVTYAADRGAKIVTNSYSTSPSAAVQNAASYLRSKGGIMVASAGNDGAQTTYANPPMILTVAATNSSDARASWSNFGDAIDVSGPGVSVYTTFAGGGYGNVNGTSFSAPSAAAVLALIFAANPNLTPDQAENILKSTAVDLGNPGWDPYFGWGRIDAAAAVQLARDTSGNVDTTPPTAPSNLRTTSVDSTKAVLAWTASTDASGIAGYDVYRDGVKVRTVTQTNHTDSTVTAGATHSYYVKAFDPAGNVSGASNTITVSIPEAVLNVSILSYSVSVKSTSSATITWTTNIPSTGMVAYGTSNKSLNQSATSGALSTTHSVTLTGLRTHTNYWYRIAVVSEDGSSSASSPVSNFKTLRK